MLICAGSGINALLPEEAFVECGGAAASAGAGSALDADFGSFFAGAEIIAGIAGADAEDGEPAVFGFGAL